MTTARPLGASFAPTTENAEANAQAPPEFLPQAIQILSLRLPGVLGAQAPSSDALLRGGMDGGNQDVVSAVVSSVLQSVSPLTAIASASCNVVNAVPQLQPFAPLPDGET